MASRHKIATEQDWRNLGILCKRINRDLQDSLVLASKMINIKDCKSIEQASKKFDDFRFHAENIMFTKSALRDNNIFHGNT